MVHSSAQAADPDEGSAVCAIRPHPDADNPNLHALPPDLVDQFGRTWAWTQSTLFGDAYRHDGGGETVCRDPQDLTCNAFEWAWAESRAGDLGRQVMLALVWHWELDPETVPTWPGYWRIWDRVDPRKSTVTFEQIEDAVLELVALGELSLDPRAIAKDRDVDLAWGCPSVRCWLPAYELWARRDCPSAVTG